MYLQKATPNRPYCALFSLNCCLVSQVHNFRTSKNYNWNNVDIGVNQQSHISFDHHDRHHIHIANEEDIAAGLKAERTAYVTEEYASYWDALGYFLRKCNIMGAEKHFPDVFQQKLFIGSRGES